MSPALRATLLDQATVDLMERTSWRSPRDVLRTCLACRMPFWSHHGAHRYCEPRCRSYACYWRVREVA